MKNPIEAWRGTRNPFHELQQMQNSIERLFDDLAPWPWDLSSASGDLSLRCDVEEDKENYYLKFDLPGVAKERISVELSDNVLTVSAARESAEEKSENTGKRRRFFSELSYGVSSRSLTLPGVVDQKKVDALYENGVLTVTVPKEKSSDPKQIPVH